MKIMINDKLIKGAAILGAGALVLNGISDIDFKKTNELEKTLEQFNGTLVQQTTVMGVQSTDEVIGVKTPPSSEKDCKQITYQVLKDNGITIDAKTYGDHKILKKSTKKKIEKEIEERYGRGDLIIFNPLDVREISNLSVDQLEKIIPNTLDPKNTAQKLYDIEHSDKPVNATFIIAKAINESTNPDTGIAGTSNLAIHKNNLFGLGANDEYKDGFEKYIKTENKKYRSDYDNFGRKYKTKADSIEALVNDYLYAPEDGYLTNEDGVGRNNGVSIFGVNTVYCSSTTKSYKLLDSIKEMEFTLKIR